MMQNPKASIIVHQRKAYFLASFVLIFSPQTKLKSKQNPKAVTSKQLKRVFHLSIQWEGLDWAAAMPVWWHCTPWLFVPASDDG